MSRPKSLILPRHNYLGAEGTQRMDQQRSHEFVSTTCMHLGRPCPAAQRMLKALAQALDSARPLTQDDFEISGESRLDGCEKACPARFAANHSRIRVFCDVTSSTKTETLDRFADAMLSSDANTMSSTCVSEIPRAFGEARPVRSYRDQRAEA